MLRAISPSLYSVVVRVLTVVLIKLFIYPQNALELSAPASDILLRNNDGVDNGGTPSAGNGGAEARIKSPEKTVSGCALQSGGQSCRTSAATGGVHQPPQQQSWFQLSGHPDCFAPAGPGTIWKKCSGGTERDVYVALSNEPSLRDIVPQYYREVVYNGQTFIELQDLLYGFRDPNVMDIKMGTRTFLESEVKNTSARPDLYLKVIIFNKWLSNSNQHMCASVVSVKVRLNLCYKSSFVFNSLNLFHGI